MRIKVPGLCRHAPAFILLCALFIRLWGITLPPVDYHHWRQTYTAMQAQYYFQDSFNFLDPRIQLYNFRNIIEFPLYTYVVGMLARVVGFSDFLARFVSVLFSLGAAFSVYQTGLRISGRIGGFIAGMLFAILPLCVFYTRAIMHESALLFCSALALHMFFEWEHSGQTKSLRIGLLAALLAVLIKPLSVALYFPIFILLFLSFRKSFLRPRHFPEILVSLLIIPLWYKFRPLFFDSDMDVRLQYFYTSADSLAVTLKLLMDPSTYRTLYVTRLGEYMLAFGGYFLLLAAIFRILFRAIRKIPPSAHEIVLCVWFFAVNSFYLLALVTNLQHEYYQLPVILPSVLIVGSFCALVLEVKSEAPVKWKKIFVFFCLTMIPFFSAYRLHSRLEGDYSFYEFGQAAKQIIPPGRDVIYLEESPRTETAYFTDRPGYLLISLGAMSYPQIVGQDASSRAILELEQYRTMGAKYLVCPYPNFFDHLPELKAYLDNVHHRVGSRGFVYELKNIPARSEQTP